jgi:signal transduction histidine kinase
MKFKCFIITGFFCCLFSIIVFSQDKQADSLLTILSKAKEDTNKVYMLTVIAKKLSYMGDDANALEYANKAMELAKKLNLTSTVAQSYETLSTVYTNAENMAESDKNLYMALKLYEELGDKEHSADCLTWIGFNSYWQENYDRSFNAYSTALKLYKETGSDKSRGFLHCYIFIANIYRIQKKYTEALEYNSTGLKLSLLRGDKQMAANAYSCMGDILSAQITSGQSIRNSNELSAVLKEALKNYIESLNNFRDVQDYGGMGDSYQHLAEINTRLHQFLEAQKYADSAFMIAKKISSKDNLGKSYLVQAKLDSAQGNYKRAYGQYKLYILYRDSLLNEETTKKSLQTKLQYEFDKKEDSLKQKQIITETKLTAQKKQKYLYWGSLVLLAALTLLVFFNFRNQKKINRLAADTHHRQTRELAMQNQEALMNERLRISSELHDEVGATLSGIAMYSHLTKEQMKSGQTTEIEKSLNVMQQSSAQMVDKLNDIVWLINPEQDSLQKLIERLEEYVTDMGAIKNMKVKITVPDKIAEINLPVGSRRNIYLFCKEAINNAVKYSLGSLLELTVRKVDNKLEFSVSDNGKGFDAVMVRRGNGLENMQKRADEIGAKLILQSTLNEGASLSLQCKIT